MAAGLSSSAKATLIDNRSGLRQIETKSLNGLEFYSGFWIISASTEQRAQEIALGFTCMQSQGRAPAIFVES